ncbi:tape measure protein [Niabella sp. CJ426]|uniref:tape measure protein n=1 Tax=Niabella sp. CJ426 TaxID=3393740 RepID=UPI003D014BD8
MSNVTKIYELRTLGYSDIQKQLANVAKSYDVIKKAKQAAEKGLYTSTDVNDIKKYADEVGKLKQKEQELKVERQQMMNEMKAINLERQKELNAQREQAKQNKIVAGSYNDIYKQYRELYNLTKNATSSSIINFRGKSLGYEEAIDQLTKLAAAEQNFRRQFSKDGLLVSEYTSGIVNAFKKMGLDDLIKGQITKAQQSLKSLDGSFEELKKELGEVKSKGDGSFESIEKKMVENRKEAANLSKQLEQLKNDYRGVGSIGDQITSGINKGFKELRGQMGSFMLQYLGYTAIFNSITSGVTQAKDQAVALDSLESSMKAVSGSTQEYAMNQAFLNRVTGQYGTLVIDTSKGFTNFYTASTKAGISAETTRNIFESVIDAATVLKKSQDDINGVLIAFGQIASKGKVQAEELRGQIGERLPGAFSIAAKAMGVTEKELNKMMETGNLASSDFLPKFAEELRKTFTTGGREVESLSAIINRGQNRFTKFVQDNQELIGKAIVNFTKLTGVLITIASVILSLPFPLLLTGLVTAALFTDNWAAAKLRLLVAWALERTALGIEIAQMAIRNAILASAITYTTVYNGILLRTATSSAVLSVATRVLAASLAFISAPLGFLVTTLAIVLTMYGIANSRTKEYAKSILDLTGSKKIDNEISQAAIKIAGDQINRLTALGNVIKNNKDNLDLRAKAANEAIKINYAFSESIKDNIVNEQKFMATLRQVRNELLVTAKARASQDATERELKNVEEIRSLRAKIAIEAEQQKGKGIVSIKDLSKDQQAALGVGSFSGTALSNQIIGSTTLRGNNRGEATFGLFDVANIDKILAAEENKRQAIFDKYYQKNVQFQNAADAIRVKDEQKKRELSASDKLTSPELQALIDGVNADLKTLREGDPKLKELQALRKGYQDRLDAINGVVKKEKPYGGARLTGAQRDNVKDIEADRDKELAVNESAFIQKNKTEEQYLQDALKINKDALDSKIKLLKGNNAEERKQIAQASLEKQKIEKETNDKIFDIKSKALKDKLDADEKAAQDEADKVKNNPSVNITDTQRVQAQLDADKKQLELYNKYDEEMTALEKTRNINSIKNAADRKDAISNINQEVSKDEAELVKANIEDTKKAGEAVLADFNLVIDRAAALIQADNRLSQSQKNRKLQALEREREYGILVRQAANYKVLETEFKRAYKLGLVTLKDYEEIVKKLQELQNQIANDPKNNKLNFKDAFRTDVGQDLMGTVSTAASRFGAGTQDKTILGLKVNAEQAQQYSKAFSKVVSDSYSTAEAVMSSYFNKEANAIEYNLRLQLERIKMEEDQVKAKAKTTAEREAIEKRYDARRKAAEQAAFEKTKELKKKEAKISLATELAGIWASVWSIGNPIAAAILGAVMTGLAVVRYGMRISEINSQKFEYGGSPDDVPKKGGPFGGKPHSSGGTPFKYKGREYEAEVDELAIVRTKNADKNRRYTISGNHSQIASMLNKLGGGIDFRPGASLKKFEYGGSLGAELQAPVMPSQSITYVNAQNNLDKYNEVIDSLDKKTDAINGRIDRLEVVQKTSTVTEAQTKEAKQKSIGTL